MKFYSTRQKNKLVNLSEAVLNSLALDGGLYMPCKIPKLPNDFFANMKSASFQDIAFEAGKDFFLDETPNYVLKSIINDAFNFEIPIVKLDKNLYTLELFHGPTFAFKDFGARFMARLLGYFAKKSQKKVVVLVATSGDTGSAAAHGFLNVDGVKVVILYPSGKISALQEKQLTTMGGNISAVEICGAFDDCQKLAKQAFLDNEIKQAMTLASANSINIARLLPQSFYYFYLCAKFADKKLPIAISVPSGNFGNLTAGIIAKKMGAPIYKFIASTNQNNVVPEYLKTGIFKQKPTVSTISNAMDVGNPSNFERILELYDSNVEKMRLDIYGASFSDDEIKKAILDIFEKYDYIMDPHGAVAYLGTENYQKHFSESIKVFFETAHPSKFYDIVEKIINAPVNMPHNLKKYLAREKQAIYLKDDFESLKKFLLELAFS